MNMIVMLAWSMGAACLLFIAAYTLARKKIQPLHQYLAGAGVFLTVAAGLILIISVQLVNRGDLGGAGIILSASVTPWMAVVHRVIAAAVFIVMLYLAISGWMKRTHYHRVLGLPFLLTYIAVYISGLLLFESAQ